MQKINLNFISYVAAILIVALTLSSVYLPSFELIYSFQNYLVHFMFLLIGIGLIGLIINNKTLLFVSFGCAVILAVFLKSASNQELKNLEINNEVEITIAHINLSLLSDMSLLKSLINDKNVDVISFQEFTPNWYSTLPLILKTIFPFNYTDVRADIHGKAIFSKFELTDALMLNYENTSFIKTSISKMGKSFNLISAYIMPPLDGNSKKIAHNQIGILVNLVNDYKQNLILSGEFNQVYWSKNILFFRKKTGLLNSRRNADPSTLKMPFDHIFYTSDLENFYFEDLNLKKDGHIGSIGSYQIKKVSEN